MIDTPPPKKYSSTAVSTYSYRIVPFPKAADQPLIEAVVSSEGSLTYQKLMNPMGGRFRPLVTPFFDWFLHVKIHNALKGLMK